MNRIIQWSLVQSRGLGRGSFLTLGWVLPNDMEKTMNVNVILKPDPHCPIPYGHPLYRGFVPSEHTNIMETWAKALGQHFQSMSVKKREVN